MANVNYNNKGNFNFIKVAGSFGKFSHYNDKNTIPVLDFSLSLKANNGYVYLPLVAWGKTATNIHNNVHFKDFIEVHASLRHTKGDKVPVGNNHKMNIAKPSVYKYNTNPKHYENQGTLVGNFDKYSNYNKVGKNNTPVLNFNLSVKGYNGKYSNIPLTAWGKNATDIHKNVHFKDFIEVTYFLTHESIKSSKGYNINYASTNVYKYRMLKANSQQATTTKHAKPNNSNAKKVSKVVASSKLPF